MTDFTIKKSKKNKAEGRTVNLSGDMTILHAAQAREALLDVFSEEQVIRIDIKGITSIDLTGLQLLCSAHRAAMSVQKTLVIDVESNPVVAAAAEAAGFPRHVGCAQDHKHSCIWVGGN